MNTKCFIKLKTVSCVCRTAHSVRRSRYAATAVELKGLQYGRVTSLKSSLFSHYYHSNRWFIHPAECHGLASCEDPQGKKTLQKQMTEVKSR